MLPIALLAALAFLQAQSLEEKAKAKFEGEGAVNMTTSELILLCHDYKRSLDWEIQRGMQAKFRVGQLEVVVQNLVNDLMAVYWYRDKIKDMREEEAKLAAQILALKGEVNGLQRKADDLRRAKGRVTL